MSFKVIIIEGMKINNFYLKMRALNKKMTSMIHLIILKKNIKKIKLNLI